MVPFCATRLPVGVLSIRIGFGQMNGRFCPGHDVPGQSYNRRVSGLSFTTLARRAVARCTPACEFAPRVPAASSPAQGTRSPGYVAGPDLNRDRREQRRWNLARSRSVCRTIGAPSRCHRTSRRPEARNRGEWRNGSAACYARAHRAHCRRQDLFATAGGGHGCPRRHRNRTRFQIVESRTSPNPGATCRRLRCGSLPV